MGATTDEFPWCSRLCPDPDEHSAECVALQCEAEEARRLAEDPDDPRMAMDAWKEREDR